MRSVVVLFNLLACLKLVQTASIYPFDSVNQYLSNSESDSSVSSKASVDLAHDDDEEEEEKEEEEDFVICIPTNSSRKTGIDIDKEFEENERSSLVQGYDDVIDNEDEETVTSVSKGCAETANDNVEEEEEEVEVIPPLFPRLVGIRNHALNCYASALLACLYNIPTVQEALFANVLRTLNEPNTSKYESLPVALATIFHKMRSTKSFIDLESYFVPAVKKTIKWKFEYMECVLDFWLRLSAAFPKEMTDLFKVETTENHFRESDRLLINSNNHLSNIILVCPSKKFKTIEKMLENDFIDEDAESFIISPEEQELYAHVLDGVIEEKVSIPSVTTFTITNAPKVLIFGIKRIYWDAETQEPVLNKTPLGFPETLNVNGEEYICSGNIEYDQFRRHYFAQNLDLLNDQWYVHDDKIVELIPDTTEAFNDLNDRFATNSCMVFYMKSSLIDEYVKGDASRLDIPFEVLTKLNSRSFKPQVKKTVQQAAEEVSEPSKKKRRRSVVETTAKEAVKVVEIEKSKKVVEDSKKRHRKGPDTEATLNKKVRGPFKKRGSEKKQVIDLEILESISNSESVEHTKERRVIGRSASKTKPHEKEESSKYFRSSLGEFADIKLGQHACFFDDESRNVYLEHVLVTLSRNPTVLEILFEEVKTKSPSDFIFRFTVVIMKILLGQREVSLAALTSELREIYGVSFDNVQSTWMDLSKLLPERIAPIPDLKLVVYEYDEPIEIVEESKCEYAKISPYMSRICPAGLKINGIYYDQEDPILAERTRRSIFKSDGVILPIGVNRFKHTSHLVDRPSFDNAPFCLNRGNRHISSYIGYDPSRRETISVHFNEADSADQVLLFYKGVPRFVPISEPLNKMVLQGLQQFSELILFPKLEDIGKEMPMLSDVPCILLDEFNIKEIPTK